MDLRSTLIAAVVGVSALSCGESRASDKELLARVPGGDVLHGAFVEVKR